MIYDRHNCAGKARSIDAIYWQNGVLDGIAYIAWRKRDGQTTINYAGKSIFASINCVDTRITLLIILYMCGVPSEYLAII